MTDSTRAALVQKWRKWKRTHPDWPLTVNANGLWSKTIHGRVRYFGPLDCKAEALELWLFEKDYLLAGREPPRPGDTFSVDDLVAKFRQDTTRRLEQGEIVTARDLRHAAGFLAEHLAGPIDHLTPEDFSRLRGAIGQTGRNLRSQKNLIALIRSIFLWGAAMDHHKPVNFGPRFRAPSADALRKEREGSGTDRFIPETSLRKLLKHAKPGMRCMILLGVNCGFYAQDSIRLTFSRLHLDHVPPYHDFPRTKNGRPRKAVLWPETVEALRSYIEHHRGADPSDYVILNQYGRPYLDRATGRGIRRAFQNLLATAGVTVSPGTSIGSLRHTYGTVVDLSADQQMIDLTMGHAPKGVQKRIYSQRNLGELDRLAALAAVVRGWLFGGGDDGPPKTVPFRVVG